MKKDIGEVLKLRRKELGMSVKDTIVALIPLGITISEKTLYSWESGHRQPDSDVFLILCEIYKIENILNYFGFSSEINNFKKYLSTDDEKMLKNTTLLMNVVGKL